MRASKIAFYLVVVCAASLSIWKSSHIEFDTYMKLERALGGSSNFHLGFWLLFGFLTPWAFPRWARGKGADPLGLRLLACLLLIASLEEMSQLFLSHRGFAWDDVHTNWMGCLIGYVLARTSQKMKKAWRARA